MKKLITLTSVSLCLCFAIALVNADDQQTTDKNDQSSIMDNDRQQTGTAETATTTTTQKQTLSQTKRPTNTCTDANGRVLHKGDTEYKSCLKAAMKLDKNYSQMGGEVGTTSGVPDASTSKPDITSKNKDTSESSH